MVFKGFKQVIEQSGLTFENGYIYFVRTNDAKTEGYIYFNGKKYGNVSELRTELEAEITENAKIVSAALNDLQLQIDNINSVQTEVIEGINQTISELQGRVTTAEGDIDALESGLTSANTAITELDGRVDTAEGDIDALEGRMNTVESGLTSANAAITALDGRVDTAEDEIDALQSGLTSANTAIDALEGRMDTAEDEIDALQSGLTSANTAIDALEGRMTTAESDIDALEGRMTSAETDINALEEAVSGLSTDVTSALTEAKQYTDDKVADAKVTNFEYVTSGDSKDLVITLGDGTKYTVDAKNFIKDGMLESASLSEESGVTYLILTFNTESGKEDIKLDVSTLIDIYTGDNKTIKVENNQISAIVDQADGLVSYNSFETLFTVGGDDVE